MVSQYKRTRMVWLAAGVAAAMGASWDAVAGDTSAPATSAHIESARESLQQWAETQSVISQERKDWQLGKQVLEDRIGLVNREIAGIAKKIDDARKNVTDADTKRTELVDENERFKELSNSLTEGIAGLESRTVQLVKMLPDPIKERLKPLSQRLPVDSQSTKLSLSERYQNVIGILNEVTKFNREITVTSELRTLDNGVSAEVKALYLGLGAAYYVSAKGDLAGVGRPTPDGWKWEASNELGPRISDAIAILQNEKVATYVPVPVEIK